MLQYKAYTSLLKNKLTVIIPFLNEGEEVENTLNSIRQTAGEKVDIIIINDASSDHFPYETTAHKFRAIYIKNSRRLGVAASRDKGINLIQTPYFLLLDAHMRFYQSDWVEKITEELDNNDRVLLCCDTKVLSKDHSGKIDASNPTRAFGATINLKGPKKILDAQWNYTEEKPESPAEDIACVLGAGYAASKRYWEYLRGLEGLIYYGSDETYISLKVWLEGGHCKLLKNVQIGHIYRTQAPYKIESTDSIFNKLWIAELLLPFSYKLRTFGVLYEENPIYFKEAFNKLRKKNKKIKELQPYYRQIFTVNFEQVAGLNEKKTDKNPELQTEKEESLKKIFKQVLLNCNTLSSPGLWYGRMGCILFLGKYDHLKNNDLYEELIAELIDATYAQVENGNLNIDLSEGLCGIAYGLAWLLHHHLMEGEVNDILAETDLRIMERDPLRITDYSLRTGLAGILYYILYRLQIAREQNLPIPFDPKYLNHLYKASLQVVKDVEKAAGYEMASWLIAWMQNREMKLEIPDITQLLKLSALQEDTIQLQYIGLKNGWAGLGLNKLNE